MATRKRSKMGRIVGLALLAVVAAILLVLGALGTPPGRSLVAGLIERVSAGSGVTVTIDRLTGWLPFSLGADRIVLADADGPFAEIDGLAIDIRASALFTGNLSLNAITADRISVLRRPHLPGGGGGNGALLPFAARSVRIARLELGKALTGRPAVLALTGALVSGADGSLSAKVDARRIDGAIAALSASLTRASASAPLTASVALKESANGILLGLMGRPSGPGYALDASLGTRGDALTGDLTLTSEGDARFSGTFTLSPAGAGKRLVLNGNGNLAELVPPGYADLLTGSIAVAVDADWASVKGESLPRIVLRHAQVTTDSVHLSASGDLGGDRTDLSLAVNVAKDGGGTIALPFLGGGAEMKSLSLKGKGAPAGDVVRLDLVGQIADLRTDKLRIPGVGLSLAIEARANEPLAGGKLPFGLRVEADAIETPTGRLASSTDAPLLLTADGTFDTTTGVVDTKARLTAAGGAVTFAGTATTAGAVKGSATASFADIAPLSSIAGRALAGGVQATVEGTLAGSDPAFTLSGTTTDLSLGDTRLDGLLTGSTKVDARISGRSGAGLTISDLVVSGAAMSAHGSASFGADTIEAKLDGSIADLARLADKSKGAATFTLHASGATTRPDVDVTISVDDGRLLDQPIRKARIDLKGAPTDSGWQATLTLDGSLAGGALAGTATATLDSASGHLTFPKVNLSIGKNHIAGALESTTAGLLSGTLSLDARDLQTLAALALVPASGEAQATIKLSPNGSNQTVTVQFKGVDITYQNVAAGGIDGTVTIDNAFGARQMRGDVSASSVTIGGRRLDVVKAKATVQNGVTKVSASAKGPDIDLSTVAHLADGSVTIDTLRGTAFNTPVGLNQPLKMDLGQAQSKIAGAVLTLGGGTVRIDGVVSPQLDLTVTATRLAASTINGFVPGLGAEGSVSGRAAIAGTSSAPSIDWQVDWTGFGLAATRGAGLPALMISAKGKSTGKASTISARLSGAGLALTAEGQVPFSGPGLALKISGTAPMALLAVRSTRELRLAGNARVNVSVGGTLAAPAVTGAVDLVGATIIDSETGFGVSGASGHIEFDGRRATIQQISGRFSQGGTIALAGSIETDQPGLPADLTVQIRNGRYADGNVINTTFSGDLAVKGPLLGNGVVSGHIDLGRTQIQLPDRIGGSANAIAVEHVNAPAGFTPPLAQDHPSGANSTGGTAAGGGMTLDISLSGNSGIYVRGFGIDAEFGGSLKISGSTGNPYAVGAFQLQRGRMDAVGQRFTFTTGTLTFSGSLVPIVDFVATTQTSDATVTLNVTGPATDPQISFTSSPSMPQEEILSRLLFNQGVGNLSAAQALQLVGAVGQLTGATSGGGIVSRIRNATGLDDLDIRQNGSGGTTVGVGKRINDRIRLGVEAGTGDTTGRVTIDLDITKNLKARGSAGQDGSGQVGLTYEHDY